MPAGDHRIEAAGEEDDGLVTRSCIGSPAWRGYGLRYMQGFQVPGGLKKVGRPEESGPVEAVKPAREESVPKRGTRIS